MSGKSSEDLGALTFTSNEVTILFNSKWFLKLTDSCCFGRVVEVYANPPICQVGTEDSLNVHMIWEKYSYEKNTYGIA